MELPILFAVALILWRLWAVFNRIKGSSSGSKTGVSTFPSNIPIVGVRNQIFSITRASLRQLTGGIATLLSGYREHGQHGKPYVVYDPSAQQELLLPAQHVKWFSEQPDSKLSSYGVRQERHAVKYLHMGIELSTTMHFIERISGDQLTRNLHLLQGPVHDELKLCIDQVFGTNQDEWKVINVYNSFEDIVMPAMTRAFLGLPLSRDPQLLKAFRRYIMALGLGTIFVGELPRWLKSVVARLVKLPLWYYRNKTLSILTPVVDRQLAKGRRELKNRRDGDEDEDDLTFIRACASISEKNVVGGVGNVAGPEVIAEWIMSLGFAGSSSTVIQATNMLLDIVHHPPELQLLEKLRQEAETLLPDEESWKKKGVFQSQMIADSTIRESLRYHPILIKGLTKEVVPSAGLQLPDGTHIPKGGWVGVPVLGIHRDEKYYPKPDVYEPFRFVKKPASGEEHMAATSSYEDAFQAGQPTTTYLGFGYGRHACPGRWFAVLMLKMILAYISMHYDMEPMDPPPETKVLGDAALPPMSTTIRIRRRKTVTRS